MPLDTMGDALAITNDMGKFTAGGNNASFAMLQPIAAIIDAGFQKATPSLSNVDITPPAGSLVFPPISGDPMCDAIGKACADYWSKAIGFGTPVSFVVVGVVNDAAKIAAPIAANIRALRTGTYRTPSYFDFVDAIHREVKTIVWTVDEGVAAPLTATYTVNVT